MQDKVTGAKPGDPPAGGPSNEQVGPFQPSPFFWVLFCLWGAIPSIIFTLCFSSLGYGVEFYHVLSTHKTVSTPLSYGAPVVALLAWFVRADVAPVPVKLVLLLAFSACALVATSLLQYDMPSAPLGAFTVLVPIWAFSLNWIAEDVRGPEAALRAVDFFRIASRCSFGVSLALIVVVGLYDLPMVIKDEQGEVMDKMRLDLDCQDGHAMCLRPFIMWAFPMIAAFVHVVYASFVGVLIAGQDIKTKKGNVDSLTLFSIAIGLAAAIVWLGAEFAGANVHLSKVVTMFAFAGFTGIFIVMVLYARELERDFEAEDYDEAALGTNEKVRAKNKEHLEKLRAYKQWSRALLRSEWGEWIWGFVCFTPMPWLFVVYVAADWLRAVMHDLVVGPCFAKKEVENEAKLTGPPAAKRKLEKDQYPWASPWLASKLVELFGAQGGVNKKTGMNWSSILSKSIVLALAFLLINVGIGKATMLVLSALIVALRGVNLAIVIVVFVVVGVGMFMLPPVPGIPVYLTGGLVITSAAKDVVGYWPALCLAVLASFSLKLLAVFIQQEGIGRFLSGNVSVRKAVGVNSVQTRAIKHILMQKGLSVMKVSILVGGPDWPTSVLAGILRCSVWQCLLGTLPVIVVIAPQCAVGAFEGDDPPISQQASNLILFGASIFAMVPLGLAMYFINKTASEHEDELKQEPPDMEVLALEEAEAMSNTVYKVATDWRRDRHYSDVRVPTTKEDGSKKVRAYEVADKDMLRPLPRGPKVTLLLGWLCASISILLIALFDDHCFQEFDITDSIEEKLGGNPANVVLPLGWLALTLNVLSLVGWWLFGRWGKGAAAKLTKQLKNFVEIDPSELFTSATDTEAPAETGKRGKRGGNWMTRLQSSRGGSPPRKQNTAAKLPMR